MLVSVAGFALMQLCVKYLMHLPTTELVLFRSFVSIAISLTVVWRAGISPFGVNKKFLFLRGLFGTIALTLYFYTLQNLPIATASVIQYLSPVFTAIFAIWILKEPMRPQRWLFFLIAFIGIALIKGFDPNLKTIYLVAGVASAIFAGLAYNCIRVVRHTDKPVVIVLYFPLVAIPIMTILSLSNWTWPDPQDWIIIILMGIFTQIGQVYMTKALHFGKANVITPMKYTGIVYALGFDIFLFQVDHGWITFVGIFLVVGGVVLNLIKKD
ncbi:DMT family transporter [bacterium SCSIO 12741]|nr:DMT family transporter [bacterium SCSIO 12741]